MNDRKEFPFFEVWLILTVAFFIYFQMIRQIVRQEVRRMPRMALVLHSNEKGWANEKGRDEPAPRDPDPIDPED